MLKLMRNLALAGTAILPLTILSVPAQAAGTTSSSFQVTATVVSSCVINSVGALGFGNYDPNSVTALTGTSTININCTKNAPYTIALDYGIHGGSAANRIMQDAATDSLNYNLYVDSGYANVWNSTCTAGNNCDSGTGMGPGAGNQQTYTVYGQVPAGQNVPVGSYSDTITVTVNF